MGISGNLLIDDSSHCLIYIYFLFMKILMVVVVLSWYGLIAVPSTSSTRKFDDAIQLNAIPPSSDLKKLTTM
ncbi:hypothetical protein DICVIV_04339 [Dictyocaulus viviparus]|uniref:Transmembrane protein n=1 Tax=Dictyocaulus viviparus TaxID=29172 RepID=A0A0D8XYD5_DICVI|nr:hypothetical protein DICVIV_04339 [Dictyocaulus viviparus]